VILFILKQVYSLKTLIAEVRLYKKSDMSEIDGVENSTDTYTYSYEYTNDIDIIIVLISINYDNIRFETTLTNSNNTLPIQQQQDRWYNNP
jgi:hypothetical protein